MRTMQGSCKILEVVPVPPMGYNVQFLKSILSQAKAYVRPIQKCLSLQPLSTKVVSSDNGPQEKCLMCGESVPINSLRDHARTCLKRDLESDEDGESYNIDQDPPANQAKPNAEPIADVVDHNCDHEESNKNSDAMLAEIMAIFPNKTYRDVQQKFAEKGSVDATISAILEDDDELFKAVLDEPTPALTISDFRRHWCDSSLAEQKIHIDRQSPTLLRDVFKLYKNGLNIRAVPDVHFVGQDGSDASGPTREYFYLSMARLVSGDDNLHLFEGEMDHLMPIHCIESYDSLLFYYAGLLISHSVLHEGYPLVGLSEAAVAYIVTGSFDEAMQYLTIKDIPDLEIRNILQRMRNAGTNDELQLLNDDEVVMNSLVTAGFVNKLLNKENKEIACDKVMIHYSLMVRKLEMDDIRRGMELVQLATVLKRAKELWAEIFPRVDDIQVPAEVLVNKLKLHSSENRSDESEKFLQWTKDYVASLPVSSDDKYAPTTGRFLLFVFASPQYPTRPLYIKFNRQEKSLPGPDACLGILSIPTNASSFDEFKRRMNVTISTQAQGYGRF